MTTEKSGMNSTGNKTITQNSSMMRNLNIYNPVSTYSNIEYERKDKFLFPYNYNYQTNKYHNVKYDM